MGSLAGHLLPGSFFFILGAFWSIITSFRYIHSKSKSSSVKRQNGYKTSVTMPCLCLPCAKLRQAPVESYIKLFMGLLGILGEYVTGWYSGYIDPSINNIQNTTQPIHSHDHHIGRREVINNRVKVWHFYDGNIQHITMYSGFVFGAIVEILMHYRFEIPKKLDFVCGMIGFSVEAFLFYFHLHAREPIDTHVHVLLFLTVVGCIVSVALEMVYPSQVLFTYSRVLFTIIQGTWFYQVGFILYPPFDSPEFKWDLNDHDQMMIITATYCWHVFTVFILLLIELWIVKCFYNLSKNIPIEMDELIDIELQNENQNTMIDYKQLKYYDSRKGMDINSQDEGSNDELVSYHSKNQRTIKATTQMS